MRINSDREHRILKKVRKLSAEQILQLEMFIDSLQEQEINSQLVSASKKMSEPSFNKVWHNSEDSVYDEL